MQTLLREPLQELVAIVVKVNSYKKGLPPARNAVWADMRQSDCTACKICPKGTYSSTTGSADCTECEVGWYGIYEGATSNATCYVCPRGSWSSEPGSSECKLCPDGKTQNDTTGATSEAQACKTCDPGKFLMNMECHNCTVGSECESCSSPRTVWNGTACTCPGTYCLPENAYEFSLEQQYINTDSCNIFKPANKTELIDEVIHCINGAVTVTGNIRVDSLCALSIMCLINVLIC